MRNESHKTVVSTVLGCVNAWRKCLGWSREAAAQTIVEAHASLRGPEVTGIRFEPNTTDVFERNKVNADRIFRWLDDATKDTNLLPINFLPSILAALPVADRMALMDEILRPVGLATRHLDGAGCQDTNFALLVASVARESGEGVAAVADLAAGATPDSLRRAHKEVSEALTAQSLCLVAIEAELRKVPN